jgi:uncharacterized protein
MTKEALLVFTRNPEAGKVKTRLAAAIGNEAALAIYNQLLLYTVSVTKYLPVDKFVFYSNHIEVEDVWDNNYYFKEVQQGADLGERMKNAFASTFQKGYNRILIVGTDCPGLSGEIIMNAFPCLQSHDIVFGPAEDGGYYLVSMKKLHHELFEDISWSTSTVLQDSICKCVALQLRYYLLPVLDDIDEEKDLKAFKLHKR